MAEKLNPTTAEEKDISKAQSAQQPATETDRQPFGEDDQPDEGITGSEALAQQRTDVEGASQQPKETAEEESGFIGTEGRTDTSGELVEDEDDDEEFRP